MSDEFNKSDQEPRRHPAGSDENTAAPGSLPKQPIPPAEGPVGSREKLATEPPQKPATGPTPKADIEKDEMVLQEPETPRKPPENPATLSQKICLAGYLFIFAALLLPAVWSIINRLNASALAEVSIAWEMPAGVTLNPGPAGFRYDATHKKLIHYGVITAERKLELRGLFAAVTETPTAAKTTEPPGGATAPGTPSRPTPTKGPAKAAEAAVLGSETSAVARMETLRRSYNEAIDNLAYLANVRQGDIIGFLLVLGGLGGALGAILRSLVDFVGNACYTQQLDLKRWWPLYFTRPMVGAILGFILVVLFKAQLLTAGDAQPGTDSFWWLGVAILGGFSTVDVTLRLRLAAKALFGVGDKTG